MTSKLDRIQENANGYVIRNCPSICFGKLCSKPFLSYALNCKDCTDCVIKRVIEKCRAKKLEIYNPSIGNEHYAMANSILSTQILQLFDIEEINK